MDPIDIDRRIRRIFDEAAELSGGERAAFLERACAGDPDVRASVEALLRSLDEAGDFLVAPLREGVGSRIGPYTLLETIGEGGFGTVFLAEQRTPVVRRVALKILKLGMDTRQVIARFEAERQALALMSHPGIATVLDAGATDTGRPYFVMELVPGKAITAYCDDNHLDLRERLALFVEVCHAVHHAHQKGIVHRDLKPSNILVAVVEGAEERPLPKVIDFGIAKAMGSPLTDKTVFTEQRQLIGTPEYMSPEQAERHAADVDTRSDVYSLGILLYEMLTGTTPVEGRRLRAAAWDEMLRMVAEAPTPKPSTRVSSLHDAEAVAARRGIEPSRLARVLRGDLDWIAMKCLEKERERRFQSASELAADLERHLSGEPVIAAPPSTSYRVRKFVRRHRLGVAAGALVVLAIATAAAGLGVGMARESRQRARAERVASFLEDLLEGIRPSIALGRDTTMLREMLDGAAQRILHGELAAAPEAELSLRTTMARTYREIGAFDESARMIDPAVDLAEGLAGGRDSPALASALHERGVLLVSQSRPAEAERILERALSMRGRLVPGDDPEVAEGLLASVQASTALGRTSEAEPVCARALAMYERLGDRRGIGIATRHMANVLAGLDRPDGIEGVLLQGLEVLNEQGIVDTPETSGILRDLSRHFLGKGELAEAESYLEQGLAMARRVYGHEHPKVANALAELAEIRMEVGNVPEAVDFFRQSLGIHRRFRSGYQDDVAATQERLALALYRSGRPDEAEANLREVLDLASRASEANPGIVMEAELGLSRLYQDRGCFADAEETLLSAWSRRVGDDDVQAYAAIQGFIALYESWERAEPGVGYGARAAAWRARLPTAVEGK